MNIYLPNEATKIMYLWGMKTNLFQVPNPKRPGQAPMPQPWLQPRGMYQFFWLQPCTKGNILQLGLGDVLDGHQPLNISHKGGKFEALADLVQCMHKE